MPPALWQSNTPTRYASLAYAMPTYACMLIALCLLGKGRASHIKAKELLSFALDLGMDGGA